MGLDFLVCEVCGESYYEGGDDIYTRTEEGDRLCISCLEEWLTDFKEDPEKYIDNKGYLKKEFYKIVTTTTIKLVNPKKKNNASKI